MSVSIVFQKGWTQGRALVQAKEDDCIFLNNSHAFSHLLPHLSAGVKVTIRTPNSRQSSELQHLKVHFHNYIISLQIGGMIILWVIILCTLRQGWATKERGNLYLHLEACAASPPQWQPQPHVALEGGGQRSLYVREESW